MEGKYIKVKFLAEWMGHPENSELDLIDSMAKELLDRGTVEFVLSKKEKKKKEEEDDKKIDEAFGLKSMDSPPKNKMMKSENVKKKDGFKADRLF